MSRCYHPNVLFLLDFLEDQSNFYLVTEYCPGGDLGRVIRDARFLDESDARRFFRQLIDGLTAVHGQGFAHRDVKPGNLLFDARGQLRLTDFEFAADCSDSPTFNPHCGTVGFTAPEVAMRTEFDPLKADVWACGCVVFLMVTGRLPFPKGFKGEIQEVTVPQTVSGPCAMLIRSLLKVNPDRRPELAQIAAHEWLAQKAPGGSKPPLISTMGLGALDTDRIGEVLRRHLMFLHSSRSPSSRREERDERNEESPPRPGTRQLKPVNVVPAVPGRMSNRR
jgi:serine/threonine protein kinase